MIIKVKIPATSANLGAGFDALGLALQLHNAPVWERLGEDEILPADRLKSRWYLRFDKKPNHCLCMLDAEVIEDSEDCYAVITGEVSLTEIGVTLSEKFVAMRVL